MDLSRHAGWLVNEWLSVGLCESFAIKYFDWGIFGLLVPFSHDNQDEPFFAGVQFLDDGVRDELLAVLCQAAQFLRRDQVVLLQRVYVASEAFRAKYVLTFRQDYCLGLLL